MEVKLVLWVGFNPNTEKRSFVLKPLRNTKNALLDKLAFLKEHFIIQQPSLQVYALKKQNKKENKKSKGKLLLTIHHCLVL